MFENNPTTRNTQVHTELKKREVQSVAGTFFDLREFDTGQILLRVLAETSPRPKWNREPKTSEVLQGPPIPQLETFGFHHSQSHSYRTYAGGSSAGGDRQLKTIDDLTTQLINQIERPMLRRAREWGNPIETLVGIVGTAAGHGNMHPAALLSPRLWLELLKSHTIGSGYTCYNFEKGMSAASAEGRLISRSEIESGYDGFVAQVSQSLYSDEAPQKARSLVITIFNPARRQEAPSQRLPDGTMPTLENTFFEISRFRESTEPITTFYAKTYADAKHQDRCSELEEQDDEGTYYVQIDPLVARHLLSLADLPVSHSDCGSHMPNLDRPYAWGSPMVSYEGASREIVALYRRAVDFLNDRAGWVVATSDSAVEKALAKSPSGGVMRISWNGDNQIIAVKPVPEELKKQVRMAILFGGDQSPWSRLFGGATSFDLGLLPVGARFIYLSPEEI